MKTYRQLNDIEILVIAQRIRVRQEWQRWKDFVLKFFGENAVSVEVQVQNVYNDEGDEVSITRLEVLEQSGNVLMPNIKVLNEHITQRRLAERIEYQWLLCSEEDLIDPAEVDWMIRQVAEIEVGINLPLEDYSVFDLNVPPFPETQVFVETEIITAANAAKLTDYHKETLSTIVDAALKNNLVAVQVERPGGYPAACLSLVTIEGEDYSIYPLALILEPEEIDVLTMDGQATEDMEEQNGN